MFHSFFNSLSRSKYLSFFSHSFSFILWSAGTAKSTILQILFFVALYWWLEQTTPLSVSARNQSIFGREISPYPKVVRGCERELAGQRSWQAVGDGAAEREWAEELAWNHGQMRSTPETVGDKIGASEEDWVKRCRHSSACGIFASNPR